MDFNLGNFANALSVTGQNKRLADQLQSVDASPDYTMAIPQVEAPRQTVDANLSPLRAAGDQTYGSSDGWQDLSAMGKNNRIQNGPDPDEHTVSRNMEAAKGQDYIEQANAIVTGKPAPTNVPTDDELAAGNGSVAKSMDKLKTAASLVASFYTGGAAGLAQGVGEQALSKQGEQGKKAGGIMGMLGGVMGGGSGGGGLFG